jgi:hypothetical protein
VCAFRAPVHAPRVCALCPATVFSFIFHRHRFCCVAAETRAERAALLPAPHAQARFKRGEAKMSTNNDDIF